MRFASIHSSKSHTLSFGLARGYQAWVDHHSSKVVPIYCWSHPHCLSIYLSVYLSVYRSIYLSIQLGTRRTDGRGVSVIFQLARTFVSQLFLHGTFVYCCFIPFFSLFHPIFSMFQETLQCFQELIWWHGSLVLSPSPLKHEFRNYWRKNSVILFLLRGIDMSREPFKL